MSNSIWKILKDAAKDYHRDDVPTLGAGLAFFTVLSLAPLIVILITFSSYIGVNAQEYLIRESGELLGVGTKEAVSSIIRNAKNMIFAGKISAIVSILILLYSATRVFSHLHKSINRIWGIRSESGPVWRWVKKHLVSLGMIMFLMLLLFASAAVTAVKSVLFSFAHVNLNPLKLFASLFVFGLIFAMILKFIPSVKVRWRDTWVAAAVCSFLFTIVNFGIGRYLKFIGVLSAYGAAGSFVIFLLWVYASALILFFGAEVMQVYYRHKEKDPLPPKYS